jgi:hypothetical protein
MLFTKEAELMNPADVYLEMEEEEKKKERKDATQHTEKDDDVSREKKNTSWNPNDGRQMIS